jgi:hypothetical protein
VQHCLVGSEMCIRDRPYIDKNEIYVFGHSMGGCIALALSLHKDLPIRFTGACSGIFEKESFAAWANNDKFGVPFHFTNEDECVIRCPVYFLDQMQRPHYLYMGTEDGYEEYNTWIRNLYKDSATKLIINQVPGDHFSSLKPSINRFFEVVRPNFYDISQFKDKAKVDWLKDFSKAPQIPLTNEAYFKGKESLNGASSYLIEYKGVIHGISAKHLIETRGGGYNPPMKPSELNKVCTSWKMYPRTLEDDFIVMDKLLNTSDASNEDMLLFSIKGSPPLSIKPLKVRMSNDLPKDSWMLGCPYAERDSKQNLYHVEITGFENGYIEAINLVPPCPTGINGFSGAPLVDENGEALGILVRSNDYSMSFTPIKGVLEKTLGK